MNLRSPHRIQAFGGTELLKPPVDRIPDELQGSRDAGPRQGGPFVLLAASIDAVGLTRLPGLFHKAGFRIGVLSPRRKAILSSRYVENWHPTADGPDAVASSLARGLEEFTRRFDWIVVCDEPLLTSILRREDGDRMAAVLPFLPDRARLAVYLDKVRYLQEARQAGAPIPEFEVCASLPEAKSVAARLGYPIILKRSASFAGSGVSRIANAVELASRLSGKETHGPFLVQRFVNGRVGTTTMLLDHGRPIRWFSFTRCTIGPLRSLRAAGGTYQPPSDRTDDERGCAPAWLSRDLRHRLDSGDGDR